MKPRVFSITLLCCFFVSCHVGRFVIYNFADINDYKKFPAKDLHHSENNFRFFSNSPNSQIVLPNNIKLKKKEYTFEEALKKTGTVAFMAIRNDSILYEWYDTHYNEKSIVPSFSMAKSFVSALIGIAMDEGKIKSTTEPITNYLGFLDKEKFGKISIQHLLDMQSGIRYNESYINPFGDVAKYYYGTNLKKYLKHLKIKEEPGKTFEYISLNTQILGLILEQATGKSLTEYLQEKIWSPLGMEFDASWSIDSKRQGTEKAFCCINARARDFARFGRLYLKQGNWNGKQIVSSEWVNQSVNFREAKNYFLYSNQWWHTRNFYPAADTVNLTKPWLVYSQQYKNQTTHYAYQPTGDFFAEGHLGQFIYVSPANNMVFVRLGKKEGTLNWHLLFKKLSRNQPMN